MVMVAGERSSSRVGERLRPERCPARAASAGRHLLTSIFGPAAMASSSLPTPPIRNSEFISSAAGYLPYVCYALPRNAIG